MIILLVKLIKTDLSCYYVIEVVFNLLNIIQNIKIFHS